MNARTDLQGTVADYIAIDELIATYNQLGDDSDGSALSMLYVPEGTFDVVGLSTFKGRKAIADMVSAATRLRHMNVNRTIKINGDRAIHQSGLMIFRRAKKGDSVTIVTTGRCTDELVRTAEGWRFSIHKVEVDIDGESLLRLATSDQ